VKQQLNGHFVHDAGHLLSVVQDMLDGFKKHILIRVFDEWVSRPEQCVET
jgi:hypothetical protein